MQVTFGKTLQGASRYISPSRRAVCSGFPIMQRVGDSSARVTWEEPPARNDFLPAASAHVESEPVEGNGCLQSQRPAVILDHLLRIVGNTMLIYVLFNGLLTCFFYYLVNPCIM